MSPGAKFDSTDMFEEDIIEKPLLNLELLYQLKPVVRPTLTTRLKLSGRPPTARGRFGQVFEI